MLYLMTIIKYLLPLATLPYLTRVLTPTYYGVINYMNSTTTYFQVLVDFGFIYSATKLVAINRENKKEVGKVLSSTIISKVILSVLGAMILKLIIPYVDLLKNNTTLMVLYYLSVVSTILLPDFIYRGFEKMEIVSIRFLISRVISTALTFVFVRSANDILLIPVLTICGNVLAVIFSYLHLFKKERIHFERVNINDVFASFRTSSIFFLATFATTAFGATTTFLMGIREVSNEDIAFWGIAYQIICTIEMLYDPIISSLYPHMVRKNNSKLVFKVLLIVMPLVLIGVVSCYFLSPVIIKVAGGSEYLSAVPIFRILLILLIFSFPAQLLGFPFLAPIKKEKFASLSTVVSAAYHVIGLFFLIGIRRFDLISLAVLRVSTGLVLLLSRVVVAALETKKAKNTPLNQITEKET